MTIGNVFTLTQSRNGFDLEQRRKSLLLLLGAWIVSVITLGTLLGVVSNRWYIVSLPAILLALLTAYVVYWDYSLLQESGEAWETGGLTLGIATAILPPFVLVYLWKRGKSLDD